MDKTASRNPLIVPLSTSDPPQPRRNHRAVFIGLAKYALGLGLLGLVIGLNWHPESDHGLAALWRKHVIEGQPVNWLPLLLAACICVPAILLTFVRWYILVRAQELPFTLNNALRLGLIGNALNVLLPGSVGGDVVKAACIAREQDRRTVAVATVLIDRAVGLWGLMWLVVLLGGSFWALGWLQGEAEQTLHSIVIIAGGLVAATVLVWLLLGVLPQRRADRFGRRLEGIPRIGHSAAEFWRAVWMYRRKSGSIVLALGLSLIGHVGFVLTFYFAAQTLYPPRDIPTLNQHFLVIPIGMAVEAGIPTPGGLGGGEALYTGLYEMMGKVPNAGLAGSLMKRMIYWAVAFVGYLVYLRMRPNLTLPLPTPDSPLPTPH